MPTRKEFRTGLAKAIKDGIDKYQTIIAEHKEKEEKGMAKLQKTLGQVDPDISGATAGTSAGAPMVSTSTWKKELPMKKDVLPGSFAGGSFDGSSMSSPDNTDGLKASEKGACMEKVTPPDVSEKTMYNLKDEYGHSGKGLERAFATAWKIHNSMKKDELSPSKKKVDLVGTVDAKTLPGAEEPPKSGKEVKAPGSGGEVTKGKSLTKIAMLPQVGNKLKVAARQQEVALPKVPIQPKPISRIPVVKGEFPAAKAVTKSPSSGPAGKAPSAKPPSITQKVSSL